MMKGLSSKNTSGISLIEMMVSMAILSITLTSFMTATGSVSKIFYHQRMLTEAISVGETLTESLLLLDPSADDLKTGSYSRYYSLEGVETTALLHTYTANWAVESYDPVPGMRELEITVSWDEMGETRSISWVTFRN